MHTEEEAAGFGVAVLLAVDDVAALLDQKAGDGVDDGWPVRAAQRQDEVVASEGVHGGAVSRFPGDVSRAHEKNY